MQQMSKRERVDAALKGAPVDRVPVSAWRHFIPAERHPASLADASLQDFTTFDWDWLKVNPRASYYAEAWGNQYDFDQYDGVRPRFIGGPVATVQELERIQPLSPTEGVFADHLDLLRRIGAGINGAHFIQTIFSPLSVLAELIARPAGQTREESRQARYMALRSMLVENPAAVHAALQAIAQTLAGYAEACVGSGASGIFLAIVRLAREDALSRDEFMAFGRPYDLQVLKAVQGAPFHMLHICGPRVYFDLIADYPVHAVNWASVGQENPTVSEAQSITKLAVVGGVDEESVLQHGTPDAVAAAAQQAIQATGGTRMLLAPGCATAMDVPPANLHALRRAAASAGG